MQLRSLSLALAKTSNTLYHQVILRERARLIKATDINFAGQRDPPRFRAEYLLLDELNDRIIDCN